MRIVPTTTPVTRPMVASPSPTSTSSPAPYSWNTGPRPARVPCPPAKETSMSAPPLSLKSKAGLEQRPHQEARDGELTGRHDPGHDHVRARDAPGLARRRQPLAQQQRGGHDVDEQARDRVPDRERLIGEDAVRVREATDTLGTERERQKTTDHSRWDEQRAQVPRPLPNQRRSEKHERKQNDCFPDIVRSPHRREPCQTLFRGDSRAPRLDAVLRP